MKYWLELSLTPELAKPILDGLAKELGVEIHPIWPRRRFAKSGAGSGFGYGYRYNSSKSGIEVSFVGKPDDSVIADLKRWGYRFCSGGFWWAHQNSKSQTFLSEHRDIPHVADVK